MKENLNEDKKLLEKKEFNNDHPEERRKILLEKRKYFREHPKEAIKEAAKNFDGY